MGQVEETVEALLIRAGQTLEATKTLHEQGFFNDAVSRGYYSMFYAAKALLLSEKINSKSHSAVIHQLNYHFVRSGKLDRKYVRMLSVAMQIREESDYGYVVNPPSADAEAVIVDATEFIATIRFLLQK